MAALEHGELPAPFDDQMKVWGLLLGAGHPVSSFPTSIDPQFAALPAIFAAAEAEPLRAAVDALYAAAVPFGQEYPLLLGELRRAFPALA